MAWTETVKPATELAVLDCIHLGELLYEIIKIQENDYDGIVLNLNLLATQEQYDKRPDREALVIIPKNVRITVVTD